MSHRPRKTKGERPSGRPQPKQPSNRPLHGTKAPLPRAPRLPGHGMR